MGALVEAGIVVGTICSLCITDPLLSVGTATITAYLYSFTQEYGYYPAKLAYDIKNGVK